MAVRRHEGNRCRSILKADQLEAIIGLPSTLFYGTGIPAALLLFNRAKPTERRGRVLFIDASKDFQPGKKQNKLQAVPVVIPGLLNWAPVRVITLKQP